MLDVARKGKKDGVRLITISPGRVAHPRWTDAEAHVGDRGQHRRHDQRVRRVHNRAERPLVPELRGQ